MEPLGSRLGHLEGVLGRLGDVLEPSWGRLGRSWSSSRPPGWGGPTGSMVADSAPGFFGGSLNFLICWCFFYIFGSCLEILCPTSAGSLFSERTTMALATAAHVAYDNKE